MATGTQECQLLIHPKNCYTTMHATGKIAIPYNLFGKNQ